MTLATYVISDVRLLFTIVIWDVRLLLTIVIWDVRLLFAILFVVYVLIYLKFVNEND